MNTFQYQKYCFTRPIGSSIVIGGLFSALDVLQGASLTPRVLATNMGGLYIYNVLQCPMEAIHGRRSAWHNVASGAIMGYVGVATERLGIPFLTDRYFFYRYPYLSPPMVGAGVYGGIALLFSAVLGGKPF